MTIPAKVRPNMIPLIWPMVEGYIEDAIKESNGELDIDDIKQKLIDAKMLLVTISTKKAPIGCFLFETQEFVTGKKTLVLLAAAGKDSATWFADMDDFTMDIARENGCDEVYIIGRKGWERMLKSFGYGHVHTIIGRKVEA